MYVTPVGPQLLCVSMLTSQRDLSFDAALTRFPRLAARLCGAARVSDPRGAGTTFRPLAAVVRGHVALLGDASGTVDAITGDGVTVALHQAVALAGALASGSLTPYARAHRRIMRLPFLMTAAMLAIHRRPRLRRQTLRLLAAAPAVFRGLLAVHTRSLPLQRRARFLRGLHGALASSIPGGGDADATRRNG